MGNLDDYLLQTPPEKCPATDYVYITLFKVQGKILFQAFDVILFVGHYPQMVEQVETKGCLKISPDALVEKGRAEEDTTGIELILQVPNNGSLGLHGNRQAVQQVVHAD